MKSNRSCHECSIGVMSGVGRGRFCPFIERTYQPGDVLCRKGQSATYAWFVRSGKLALEDHPDPRAYSGSELSAPSSFVRVEALVSPRYRATARARSKVQTCGATRDGLIQWLTSNPDGISVLLSDVQALSPTDEGGTQCGD